MIDYYPYNFDDIYKSKNNSILLAGNGFNMNFDIDTSHENIYEKIIPIDDTEFFKKAKSRGEDLEDIFRDMQSKESQKLLLDWLYVALIDIISNSCDATKRMADCIKKFKRVFTINYEFLIYRAQLTVNDEHPGYFIDGFSRRNVNDDLTWSNRALQNIFYLHGGFHILKKAEKIIKVTVGREPTLACAIASYRKENPDAKIECIFGPTSAKKMEDIEDNPYTKHALYALGTIEGIIFLYGVSLDQKDKHIWGAIYNNPNIEQVNISYNTNLSIGGYKEFVDNARSIFPNKNVHFYDSQSINTEPSLAMDNSISLDAL